MQWYLGGIKHLILARCAFMKMEPYVSQITHQQQLSIYVYGEYGKDFVFIWLQQTEDSSSNLQGYCTFFLD
jgi:hypothetical protein